MFGIGFTEIILIVVLALVVLGPDKLPQLGKTLARFLSDFNKVKRDFRMTISDIERAGEPSERGSETKPGDGDGVAAAEAKPDIPGVIAEADEITFEPEPESKADLEAKTPPKPEGSIEAAGVGRKPVVKPARPRRRRTAASRAKTAGKPKPTIAKTEAAGAASATNGLRPVKAKRTPRKPALRATRPKKAAPEKVAARSAAAEEKAENIFELIGSETTGASGEGATPSSEPTSKPTSNQTSNSNKGEA